VLVSWQFQKTIKKLKSRHDGKAWTVGLVGTDSGTNPGETCVRESLMYLRAELIVASLMFSFPLREVSHFPSPLPIISPLRTSMCAFIVVPPLSYIFFTCAILFALCYLEHLSLICFIKSSHLLVCLLSFFVVI